MNAKPILMNAEMVRATLREIETPGTGKTQTRRLIKPQPATRICNVLDIGSPEQNEDGEWGQWETTWSNWTLESRGEPLDEIWHPMRCPYGKTGDLLYVRETIVLREGKRGERVILEQPRFVADDQPVMDGNGFASNHEFRRNKRKVMPSIHMPRWASRITLEVTDVVLQRVQDISRGECMSEGCPFPNMSAGPNPRDWLYNIWTSIYGTESWNRNDWVWAVSFTPHLINVDQFAKDSTK